MKRLMVAIVFVLAGTAQLFAQEYEYVPFPKTGVLWSEIYYVHDENAKDKTSYECFAVNGEDTIINNLTYTKVYHFYDSVFDINKATCVGAIREDSLKRVFYIGNQVHQLKPQLQYTQPGKEIILFDFSLEVGDSIDFVNCDIPSEKLFVTKIDTILVGGELRKQFYFRLHDIDLFWGFTWIEGIGSTRGLLFVSGTIPMSYHNRLICYFKDDELLFHNTDFNECFLGFVGVDELELKNIVVISPNPVINNEITFRFNDNRFETIMVYNKNGQLVGSYQTESSKSLTIRLPQAFSGVYFYKAITGDGKNASGKFVIQ